MKKVMVLFVAVLWATIGFSDEALKGLYKFDDGSGVIATDSSALQNDANLVNSPEWVEADGFSCLEFDMNDKDHLDLGTAGSVTGGTDFSVSFRIKTSTSNWRSLVRQCSPVTADAPQVLDYATYINDKGKLVFKVQGQFITVSPNVVTDNSWKYVTCVRSGENGFLYIDGVKVAEDQGAVVSLTGANTLFGLNNLTDGSGYNGLLDELRIYHKALSAEEIEFYANVRDYEFAGDADGDGLTNGEEYFGSTDMTDADIDGDGLNDKQELEYGTDPSVHNGNVKEGFEIRAIGSVYEYTVTYDEATDSHQFNVRSGDVWNNSDNFVFVAKPLTNNSRLTVKLYDYANVSAWSKAGVMVRDSYDTDSRHAFSLVSGRSGSALQFREKTGGGSGNRGGYGNQPMWLTIVCHDGRVTSYVSDDFANGTFHWIKVGSQNVTFNKNTKVGLAVCSNNHKKAIQVKLSNLEVAVSGDMDGDSITDWEERNVVKTNEVFADTEDDGINDDAEIVAGTHPNFAETTIDEKTFHKRGLISKYFKGIYNAFPEFNKLPLYATGTVDQLYFPRLNGKSFGGPIDNGAASFAGKLYVDVAGSYKFYTVSDDGSKLYINGNAVVANGGNHGMRERSGALSLTAGFHDIKIDYYDAGGPGGIKMFWEGPNFTRQVIPASVLMHSQDDYDEAFDAIDQDGDGLTDKLEDAYGSDKTKVDSNGDGLTDFERYSLGLDAMTIDTDGDGFSDYKEVKEMNTDPKKDQFGDNVTSFSIDGSSFRESKGNWSSEENSVVSQDRRGELSYSFDVANASTYQATIYLVQVADTIAFDESSFIVHLDGELLGVFSYTSVDTNVSFLTQPLEVGSHTLTIFWDNLYKSNQLKIDSIDFGIIDGDDLDSNGVVDWVEDRVRRINSVETVPVSSKTSPFCIEGNAKFLSSVKVNGNSVNRGMKGHWYANVPLLSDGTTAITVEFAEGIVSEASTVEWTATNMFDGQDVMIRKGDSLLLNPVPLTGVQTGTAEVKVGDAVIASNVSGNVAYKFEQPGVNTVAVTWFASDGTISTATLNVSVISINDIDSPAVMLDTTRSWSCEELPSSVALEAEGMVFDKVEGASVPTYSLMRSEVIEDVSIISRLGEDGPILSSIPVEGFWFKETVEGYAWIVEVHEDGTKRVKYDMISYNVPKDVIARINIIVSGVMFLDGATSKDIPLSTLSETGEGSYEFLQSPDSVTAACRRTYLIQNDVQIGSR